jgi:hypothetical protein
MTQTEEIIRNFTQMKDMMMAVSERLKEAEQEIKKNESKYYWMSVKMYNNRHFFEESEIQRTDHVMKRMSDMGNAYNRLSRMTGRIIGEYDDALQKLENAENAIAVAEEIDTDRLYQSMVNCVQEMRQCTENQKEILRDAAALGEALQKKSKKRKRKRTIKRLLGISGKERTNTGR